MKTKKQQTKGYFRRQEAHEKKINKLWRASSCRWGETPRQPPTLTICTIYTCKPGTECKFVFIFQSRQDLLRIHNSGKKMVLEISIRTRRRLGGAKVRQVDFIEQPSPEFYNVLHTYCVCSTGVLSSNVLLVLMNPGHTVSLALSCQLSWKCCWCVVCSQCVWYDNHQNLRCCQLVI